MNLLLTSYCRWVFFIRIIHRANCMYESNMKVRRFKLLLLFIYYLGRLSYVTGLLYMPSMCTCKYLYTKNNNACKDSTDIAGWRNYQILLYVRMKKEYFKLPDS